MPQELVVFPFLNTKMDFSNEASQHEVIHATLEKLLNIIHTAKADPSLWNPKDMQELMVAFREPLYTHLDEEVDHITSKQIKDAGFQPAEILDMISKLEAYAKANADPFLQVPYMRR